MSSLRPVVVAGLDLNGLGVVRALGQAGVPVAALDTSFAKPTAATRFCTKIKVGALSGPAFIDELLRVRGYFQADPVLILTQEPSVVSVSAGRERLASKYRFTMPPHDVMTMLLDKLRFQEFAERHGFPIPRSVRLARGQGTVAAAGLRFPCALKPAQKHEGYSARFAKAYKVASLEDLSGLWSQMQDVVEDVIVQEWIEGGDSDVYFCLQYRPPGGGEPTSFTGRKLCQWPPLVGGTATCVPAPNEAQELNELTNRFFTAAGFSGIGSMEYKRDPRDGRFYMVEPTVGRSDYQEEIAALNGVNVPLAAYYGELGMTPPAARTVRPVRAWSDPQGYANARAAGAPDPLREIWPDAIVCDAYFRAGDPMPYVSLKLEAVRRKILKLSRLSGRRLRRQVPAGIA